MDSRHRRSDGTGSSVELIGRRTVASRLPLNGPARRVAMAGALIVLLLLATVGITLSRYGIAESRDRAALANEGEVALAGAANQALVLRADLVTPRGLDALQTAQLHTEQAAFAHVIGNDLPTLSTYGGNDVPMRAAVLAANSKLVADENAIASTLGTQRASQRLLTYDTELLSVERTLNTFIGVNQRQSTAEDARARSARSSARWAGIIAGVIAVLVSVGLIGYMVRMLRRVFDRLSATVPRLTEATLEMRTSIREAAAATNEQSASIAQAAATIDELGATAASIAANAESSNSAAHQTGDTMEQMQQQVNGIAERSLALGQGSQKIGEILELINDIAEQTNILALNAAIEAARAGDAGRGFAVVATEVRKLAERSIRSTASIREIVRDVQDQTNATILATERGSKHADEVVELMRSAGRELDESLLATVQQREAASQVAVAMGEIRSAAQQLSTEQERTLENTESVEVAARELHELCIQYRVTVTTAAAANGAAANGAAANGSVTTGGMVRGQP